MTDAKHEDAEGGGVVSGGSRRQVLAGLAGGVLLSLTTGFVHVASMGARAHVATGGLDVSGDSITTDDGRLTGLAVSISSGHVSYDGLDTDADSVAIDLYAAPSGGAIEDPDNRIATQRASVADESSLGTRAGHLDYSFIDVDVLAAADLEKKDFSATEDGSTEETDVAFRVELSVEDADGNPLVSESVTTTATISVTNQERSGNANGNGNTNASGSNQRP